MADIAGSTAIGEALGPERSKYLFDEVMRLVAAEVERYDGTVAQLAGDGLLAVFGAPVAHEDDSERAVRAGLAIQRCARALRRRRPRGLRDRHPRADRREHRPCRDRRRRRRRPRPLQRARRHRQRHRPPPSRSLPRATCCSARRPPSRCARRSSSRSSGPTSLRGRAEPIDRYRVAARDRAGPDRPGGRARRPRLRARRGARRARSARRRDRRDPRHHRRGGHREVAPGHRGRGAARRPPARARGPRPLLRPGLPVRPGPRAPARLARRRAPRRARPACAST